MRLLISCFCAIFLLIPGFVAAQKFSTSVNFQVSFPQGEYKAVNEAVGFGIRANFLYRPLQDIPLKFGLDFGIQEKGRAVEYFSGNVMGFYDEFKVRAGNNILSLLFVTRFQPDIGKVRPFIDLTAGWNNFFSSVDIERLTYYSTYNPSYTTNTKSRWALTYGFTGGVDIPLSKMNDIGLELKLAYLFGNLSKYLTNPYINSNAEVTFQEKISHTDMLIPQAGIRINL